MKTLNYKHIIWDWNGTLLNDVDYSLNITNQMLSKRNLPQMSYEKYREIFEFPIINYYNKIGFSFESEPFEVIADEFITLYESNCYECGLHHETEKILQSIMAAGISQSILSAAYETSLKQFVNHFDITHYFIQIIGLSNHYAESKIDNGKMWIEHNDISPQEVLLIGDTVHDYETAQAMGTKCLLIAEGHHNIEKLKTCGVEVVDSLLEFYHQYFR